MLARRPFRFAVDESIKTLTKGFDIVVDERFGVGRSALGSSVEFRSGEAIGVDQRRKEHSREENERAIAGVIFAESRRGRKPLWQRRYSARQYVTRHDIQHGV